MSNIPRTSVTWEGFFYIPILPERVEFEYTERDNWVELYVQDNWGTDAHRGLRKLGINGARVAGCYSIVVELHGLRRSVWQGSTVP